jgi:zinc-binding alcohol dehydrogenase/oxidoreductase
MKAIVHSKEKGIAGLKYQEVPEKKPGYGEVKVKLKAVGLNRRDLFVINNRTSEDPVFIPGSDGAGFIEEIGEGVSDFTIHTEVIINPSLDWEFANEVPTVPKILGGPSDGTFSEYVIISSKNVVKKPSYLSWEEAGVLSLSALTAYRALFTKGNLKKDQHLLIPGIGSGVATYAMLFAKAIGAKVSVTSRREEKRQQARNHGADRTFDNNTDWNESLEGEKVDVVLDSVGPATFPHYFDVLRPNGYIVNFGASSGDKVEIPLRTLFYPQFNILGTSMGSREEFEQMIEFITKHSLKPIIDKTYSLSEAILAFDRMNEGEQFGNIALLIE